MMSGAWEVVGKSKKDKQTGKSKKLTKQEKQKFVENAPKVEELLPLAQVKTLYAALDTNKQPTVKPVEKAVKTKENEAKKAQKKPKEKKEQPAKEIKPPKTIEAAVALITSLDVENVLDIGQMRFPDAPLVWLKGLASWLNTKLPVDHTDNAFTAKSFEYPLCLLNADIRAVLKKALKGVPEPAIQMFYDYCLASMANDMTKGSPVTGYKMLLQLVATQQPSVAVSNVAKSATLRHSYQNRPAIGCSIMWALGQAGFKDISVGLQVWQGIMFPVYELRNYAQFVCDYMKHLLARHSTSKGVTTQQYLDILDSVFASKSAANHELKAHVRTLQALVCNVQTDKRLHNVFEPLLSRLSASNPAALKDELLHFLTECLAQDSQCYSTWRVLYTKYLPQSALLLRQLQAEWGKNGQRFPPKVLKETLKTFKVTNDDMTKQKQKTEGLQECSRLCEALLSKMDGGKKSFPWKLLGFLFLLAAAGVVAFDVHKHQGFESSKTGVFLKDVGVLKYGEQALVRVQESAKQAYKWSEQNVPVYTAKCREVLGPYFTMLVDLLSATAVQLVAGGRSVVAYCQPLVQQWVAQYGPGLTEAVSLWSASVWQYGITIGTLALKYLSIASVWLRENVFVGQLSPENLQRVTLEALNTTQALAAQTFSWINNKVVTATAESV
uniref:Transmembrane protein 214 n=1 Tax=Graphocephala atropunctata TaxID=36148 RepID=A0A1B6KGB0_9HEMI